MNLVRTLSRCGKHVIAVFSIMLICVVGYGLSFTEVSRFAYTSHDWSSEREPVIDYPFVYMPNSYGFQVALWDSLDGSFTEVANFGLDGMSSEMVKLGDEIYIAVEYGQFTNPAATAGALYRVNVSDPYVPVLSGTIPIGEQDQRFFQMRVINGKLITKRTVNGLITGICMIDPQSMQILEELHNHLYYEQIGSERIICRATGQMPYSIFGILDEGFVEYGTVTLNYPIGTFPRFVMISDQLVAIQDEFELKLWQLFDQNVWYAIGVIPVGYRSAVVLCMDKLVFYYNQNEQCGFYVYDISMPDSPVLAHAQSFPPGLETDPGDGNLTAFGSNIFLTTAGYGSVALELNADDTVSFVSKCSRYNVLSSAGHRYGSYILQPTSGGGIACFDISEPSDPQYMYSILGSCSGYIDICGNYLLGQFREPGQALSYFRIYDISTLIAPVLIDEHSQQQYIAMFFNYAEPGYYYIYNNISQRITKYQIVGTDAPMVYNYYLGLSLKSPVFCGNYLYMTELNPPANADLYIFHGFENNSASLFRIVPNVVPQPGYIFYAGDYLFLRNLTDASLSAGFYNQMSSFYVENDIHWGHFRDYVCVSSELGISFYATSGYPMGFQTPVYFLPQYSYTAHIEWDDDYMYLFGQDNIAIYAYDYSAVDDPVDSAATAILTCYPNPANSEVTIRLFADIELDGAVEIYNLRGQTIRTIIDGKKIDAGLNFLWDGKDVAGNIVASGIYLVKGSVRGRQISARVMILRK